MVARRGEIWWTDFGLPFGSEPGYRRPALVVQADPFNQSAIRTVVLVPLTKNLALASAPGNVRCRARDTGLRRPSVVNVSQVTVVDKRRLLEKVGTVPGLVLAQVEEGIRLVLGL
ncbi:MAG TPA: type II toxin-antitoxin system PemK/MazF family toxin [Vicinamibacteria bacterium]